MYYFVKFFFSKSFIYLFKYKKNTITFSHTFLPFKREKAAKFSLSSSFVTIL